MGLTVLLLEKHGVPLVNISAIVKAGAAADPAGQEGLATVTAGAAAQRNEDAERAAVCRGSRLHRRRRSKPRPGPDFTAINAEFLTKDLARGLDLFSDALLHPTFPQDETDKFLAQSARRRESGERRSAIGDDSVLLRLPVRNASVRTPDRRGRNFAEANSTRSDREILRGELCAGEYDPGDRR